MTPVHIQEFKTYQHTFNDADKWVYHGGDPAHPLVFLLHEIPNPTPEVFKLGRRLILEGYHVHIPVFFGTPNKEYSMASALSQLTLGCIRREFKVFASEDTSPVVDWLRNLCTTQMNRFSTKKVGMIGMCFTGNFALGLSAEGWMQAPILSQPSLPYPVSKAQQQGLHIAPETLTRAVNNQQLEILGLRFTNDWMCPRERFDELHRHFGDRFHGIEIDSGPSNQHGIKTTAHAVLTMDFVNAEGHPTHDALCSVLDFLDRRLKRS